MKIYAPNIHLYAFQLYKASNFHIESLTKENIQLWHQANDIINTIQPLNLIENIVNIQDEPKGSRVDLIKPDNVKYEDYSINFEGIFKDNNQNQNQQLLIKGFVSPIRIQDSYGFWLNLRRPEKDVDDNSLTKDIDVSLLSKLNPQNCLTLIPDENHESNKLFLGQTLLITAWLTQQDKLNQTKPYDIAQESLTAIFPNTDRKPEFNRQGKLFGSPIFEYGLFSQPENYQHVIIWLFRDRQADKNFNKCYQQLFDLFFFRSKIVKAFQDSRIIYHQIAAAYDEIENTIEQIKSNTESDNLTTEILNHLTNKLKDLSKESLKYTRLLRNLKDYQNTIDINKNNYDEKLRQISAATEEDNLSILEIFYKQDSERFYQQINADIGYFEQGLTLLEQAIASIRGIVEIEQAKREERSLEAERKLERTVQILGIGLGGGAIVSGVVTQHIDKPFAPINFKYPVHPLVSSLCWSIAATFLFIAVGWLIAKSKN
ncbi:MAG: hypothetical protein AAF915_03090 [Cyanobacteria bacterium P01_D01_bin.50]